MKCAIAYSRISTKEQSNYSLSGQIDAIRNYCTKNDIELLSAFEDDGQSAKNFDRHSWLQLENYIKENHKRIDYLIVYKYDRFSRNLTEALAMIDKLEKKYKIIILSVLENIGVHPKSPMFFFFRTQLLLNANTELNYIKERTAFGMHNGAKQGRYLHAAPIGYQNIKDDNKKPKIVPNPDEAELIKEVFSLYLNGSPMAEIKKIMQPKGLRLSGKSAIARILTNPTYAGMVKVPSYYDEPERLVDGKHEAIISKVDFWAVQYLLSGKVINRQNSEDVPLKGSLYCECGKLFTAGNSKGRSGYYWYYVCHSCKANYSAIKVHDKFNDILSALSLSPNHIEYLKNKIAELINSGLKDSNKAIDSKTRELNALEAKLNSLEGKYIENTINYETYQKWLRQYQNERFLLTKQIDDLKVPLASAWAKYSENILLLGNIGGIYHKSSLNWKKSLIKIVFDNKLTYSHGIYRTAFLHSIFEHKALIFKEKGLLFVEQPLSKMGEIPICAASGNAIEPIIKLLQLLSDVA